MLVAMASLYWYDLETFGRNPYYDRIAQFAGIRTDDEFNPVGDPLVVYLKITPDYLPDPQACLITGITPQHTVEMGLNEAEFARTIMNELSKPGTCALGYNSIRFDDEFIRNLLYRNFFDPYEREWAGGNSRWDILDLVRTAHDLRPEGIVWPKDETGNSRFKLELLSQANGIAHDQAHDALSDVQATIGLAKRIWEAQPKLFTYLFGIRRKKDVQGLIDLHAKTPFVHTSGMLRTRGGCSTSLMMPLAPDPGNNNCIYCYDLRYDPELLLSGSVQDIRRRIFTPADQLDGERIHIKGVHVNKCPSISPVSVLDDRTAARLEIDLDKAREYYRLLKQEPLLTQKVSEVFATRSDTSLRDVDLAIYSGGFFNDKDRSRFSALREAAPEDLLGMAGGFQDSRIPQMIWRYAFRNYPSFMPLEEQKRWMSFCASRILLPPEGQGVKWSDYRKWVAKYREDRDLEPAQQVVTAALEEYGNELEQSVLRYGG
ncbi:MAG: exodeoxyribonuclease I [Spirochaetales bacterium]|nr:exodeoxyribonuclease I [Spirochaetales bacterium]